jgi:hypothetical protein
MLTLGSKLNRSYSMYLPFAGDYCEISIIFNKSNSFIGFNLDHQHYTAARNHKLHSTIYHDLNKSEFAVSFLDIRNYRSRSLDIKQQFHNILPNYKDSIHYETNETIKLSKIKTNKGAFESCIYVYIFRYTDFGDDFLYCLAERQHIDSVLDKKIVRTSAIQLATNHIYDDMIKLIGSENRKYVHECSNVDHAITSAFTTRKNIKRNHY